MRDALVRAGLRALGLLGFLPEVVFRRLFSPLVFAVLLATRLDRPLRGAYARIASHQRRAGENWRLVARHCDYYAGAIGNLFFALRPLLPPTTRRPVSLPLERLERLRAGGKGVILATPHFGDLFSAIYALGRLDAPVTVLMLGASWFGRRELPNLRFVELSDGAAQCLATLKANGLVLLYDDLDLFPGGRTGTLFGAPVFAPHGPARLALASGAPILPVYALWSPRGTTLAADDALDPDGAGQDELEASLLDSMERTIGRQPEQWILPYDLWDLDAMREYAKDGRARSREGRQTA